MVRKIANICENIFTPGPKSPEPFEFLQFTQAGILNSDPGLGMSRWTTLIILHYFKNLILQSKLFDLWVLEIWDAKSDFLDLNLIKDTKYMIWSYFYGQWCNPEIFLGSWTINFSLCLLIQYHIKMTRQKYFYKVWKPGAQKKDLPVSMKTMEAQVSPCEDYL